MASKKNAAQELLAKLTLDLSEFKEQVESAKNTVDAAFETEKDHQSKVDKANQKTIAQLQKQLAITKEKNAEAKKEIDAQAAKTKELQNQLLAQKVAAAEQAAASAKALADKKLEVIAARQAMEASKEASRAALEAGKAQIALLNKVSVQKKVVQTEDEKAAARQKEAWNRELIAQDRRLEKEREIARTKELTAIKSQMLAKASAEDAAAQAKAAAEARIRLQEEREAAELSMRRRGLLGMLLGGRGLGEEHEEAIKGGASGLIQSIVGGGLFGKVATGAMVGGITVAAVEGVGEAIKELVEKFKELVKESDEFTQTMNTFQKLAKGQGIQDYTGYLEKLREVTHNLVPDTQLLRTANTFLQSGLKVSSDQMIKLTEATIGLARAQGKSPQEAIQALQQAFLTGRAWSLASVTGIQRQQMMLTNTGSAVTESQRIQQQFELMNKSILERYQKIGQPQLTFPERMEAIKTTMLRITEAMGQGVIYSGGFKVLNEGLDKFIGKFNSIEEVAHKAGQALGDMLGKMAVLMQPLIQQSGLVIESLGALWQSEGKLIGSIFDYLNYALKGWIFGAIDGVDQLGQAFAKQHPVLDTFGKTIIFIGGAMRTVANASQLVVEALEHIWNAPNYKFGFQSGSLDFAKGWYNRQQEISDQTKSAMASFENAGGASMQVAGTQDQINDLKDRIKENDKLYGEHKKSQADYLASKQRYAAEEKKLGQEQFQEQVRQISSKYHATLMPSMSAAPLSKEQLKSLPASVQKKIQETNEKYSGAGIANQYKVSADQREDFNAEIAAAWQRSQHPLENQGITIPSINIPDSRQARRLAQEQLTDLKADLAAKYEAKKAELSKERQLEDQSYQEGYVAEKDYYNKKRDFNKKEYDEAVQNAEDQRQLELDNIKQKVKNNDLTEKDAKLLRDKADKDAEKAIIAADKARADKDAQVRRQEIQADIADKNAQINTNFEHQKAALQQEVQLTEDAFKQKTIYGDQYVQSRIDQITKEVQLEKQHQEQLIAADPKNLKTLDAAQKAITAAIDKAQTELQKFESNLPQALFQDTQERFKLVSDQLNSRLQLSQTSPAAQSIVGSPQELNKKLSDLNKTQIDTLEQLLKKATPYSETWNQIYEAILKATNQQIQLNKALQDSQDILKPIGSAFDQISQQMSGIFGSRFAKGLESAISSVGQQFQNIGKNKELLSAGKSITPEDPKLKAIIDSTDQASAGLIASTKQSAEGIDQYSNQLKSSIDTLKNALTNLAAYIYSISGKGSTAALPNVLTSGMPTTIGGLPGGSSGQITPQPLGLMGNLPTFDTQGVGALGKFWDYIKQLGSPQGMGTFAKQVTGFVDTFGSAINGILHSGSAGAGGLAGLGGGMAVGETAGGALSHLGGAFSAAGPWGAAIGAGVGLLGGIISGNKQEKLQDEINQMNISFKSIMDSYSSNNANLKSTIDNLQNLILQAQVAMAGSKKDSSQFRQLIIQYQEQITQLQNQADATMTSLQEQLTSLGAPTAYQSILQQVASVVQQYEQFASAAQNATQLAQANQFLAESMQQLATQDVSQLQSDEENAIQNALQLNQLLLQRNDLQYNYLKQVESIQGQGTLTRQQTSAQSKYAQMYMASYQYSVQLDQINQQIDLAQYQVQAAQKVFNLATTKVGLEAQLLQLQEQGINKDMARIAAIQALLAMMQTSGYNLAAGTSNVNPNQQAVAILLQLLQSLGLGNVASGVSGGTDTGTASALAELYAELAALGGSGTTSTGQGNGI